MKLRSGFTLIELIMTVAIVGVLSTFIYGRIGGVLLQTQEVRAHVELEAIANAALLYFIDNNEFPPDEEYNIPTGFNEYLSSHDWPQGPWPGSVYDWDTYTGSNGKEVFQVSIRFCQVDTPEECVFPLEEWAENFDEYSSMYFCIEGICRAHEDMPNDHPGYCVNC